MGKIPASAVKADNIVLIGMPGSGKSTLGKALACALSMDFVDSDQLIEDEVGGSLQGYLDNHGYLNLRQIEKKVLLESQLTNTVLATGGSAVYSRLAMRHLGVTGVRIYLYCPLDGLRQRLGDFSQRGVASPKGQSLEMLYLERSPLYEEYADVTIDATLQTERLVESMIDKSFLGGR